MSAGWAFHDAGGLPELAALRAVLDALPQMLWSTAADGAHDFFNARWYAFTGVPHGSTDGDGWAALFHPDDQALIQQRWGHSVATGDPYEIEYRLRDRHGDYRWMLGRANPVRDASGAVLRWYGTCTDVDALKRSEEQRELIAGELSHRIRNIFTLVSSLLMMSARSQPEARAFADQVRGRIEALQRAQEQLLPENLLPDLAGADVAALVQPVRLFALLPALLNGYGWPDGTGIAVRGEDIVMGPSAAALMALVLHELATNAMKHGALAVPGGMVELDGAEENGCYTLHWRERGGPALDGPPATTGFGTMLLLRTVRSQFGGEVRKSWDPDGLTVRITMAPSRLSR